MVGRPPDSDANLQSESPFQLPRLDSEKMRSAVAAKIFGGEAAPVRIGPYTVLRRLGSGGMGVVYAAFDEALDRKIAVKVMHGRAVQQVHEDRLRSEAKALAQLSHPNVVAVYEVGDFRGQVYLAMEFLPGRTLAQHQRDSSSPIFEQLEPWIQAAKGLAAAHEAGIAHRDFKPANAMLLPDGRVKVFDFGLAIRVDDERETRGGVSKDNTLTAASPDWTTSGTTKRDESSSHPQTKTLTGALVGTPAYMSPEQHEGRRPDARSDQFSFCVALWEYYTGSLPFAGSRRAQLLASMKAGEVAPVSRSVMPGWLRKALTRGLSLEPAQRFDSMKSLVAALERGTQARRRRAWAAVALVPLMLGVGLSAYGWSRPEPCDGLGAHWNRLEPQVTLRSVAATIDASQGAVARSTFSQVLRDLQSYVEKGRVAHISACKVAMDDPEIGAAGFSAQSSCYLGATQAVRSYMQRLAVAKQKELRPELWLSSRLPSLSSCAKAVSKPGSQADAPNRDLIEKELAQSQVGLAFFDYDQALKHAKKALAMAPGANGSRLACRAWLATAKAQDGLGDYEAARKAVDRAYRMAEQVNDTGLRLECAVVRSRVMYHQGQPLEGSSQLRDIYPLAKRTDIDVERRLSYFAAACRAPRENFRLCEAHRNCVEGLRLMEDEASSVPTRNRMLRRLAWLYQDAGLVEKGLRVATKAQAELRDAVGADSSLMLASERLRLTLAGELARVRGKHPEEIKELLPDARRIHERYVETYGGSSPKVVIARTNLAELLRWAGRLDESEPLFQALLRDHPDDPSRYYTLVAYGQLQLAKGENKAGIVTLKEGLRLIEATRAHSAHSGDETMIPEEAEALFALAKVEGPTKMGLANAKRALQVYVSLKQTAERIRAKQECAELGQGIDSYGLERKAVQRWIAAANAKE